MKTFVSELRRRNVLKVATAYAVVAWIVIEAGSVLLPTFGASEAFFRGYVILVFIGFLVSLVFAWIFEITPEGVKLDRNVEHTVQPPRSSRRFNVAIIGLLAVALGISVTLNITGLRNPEPVPAPSDRRLAIAVLPFENRGSEPANEAFADGIHDDLLMRLANVGSLRVISRTSVMEYRGTTKNMRQIASELGVGSVVEGAVQRAGDSVRISAQLIDAETDQTIWSKAYDRTLSVQGIFEIQSEISAEITQALRAQLSESEQIRMSSVPTESMAAFELYTQGRANVYRRRLETLQEARRQFEDAIALDPRFAEAYVGLANSVLLLFNNHQALPRDEALATAGRAIDRALELDPGLAEAYASLGLLKQQVWQETRTGPELGEAEAAFSRAIELNPSNAEVYTWLGTLRGTELDIEGAIELYQKALQLDPLARVPYGNLPLMYSALGKNDVALDLALQAVRVHPDWPTAYDNLSQHLLGLGRMDEAVAWALRGRRLSTDPLTGGVALAVSYVEFGEIDKVRALFENLPADHPFRELHDGVEQLLQGDYQAAAEAFEAVIRNSANPRQYLYGLVAQSALLAGDFEKARRYTEITNPDFRSDEAPALDQVNIANAILYAYTLQKLGEEHRAEPLLADALRFVRGVPRVGEAGQGIRDVEILALQGKTFEALAALREAIDEGFRGSVYTNGWTLDLDPYLESIRAKPEFKAMAAEVENAVFEMRERVAMADAANDWQPLLALADAS